MNITVTARHFRVPRITASADCIFRNLAGTRHNGGKNRAKLAVTQAHVCE